MNKAYFKESFLSGLKMMLFIFVIGLLIYPVIILTTRYAIDVDYLYDQYGKITDIITWRRKSSPDVGIAIAFLAILCYIVPILKLSYLQRKRQIDSFYSLPIKRETLLNINLFVGYLQIIIPYTLIYFLGMGILMIKADFYHYGFYIPLYFVSILVSLGVYLFNSFVFTRGNSISDGIILMIAYNFVGIMLLVVVCSTFCLQADEADALIFAPFVNLGNHFSDLIMYYGEEDLYKFSINDVSLWNYFYPIINGILGYLGLFLTIKYDRSERAEQITDSYFGYRTIIPFFFCTVFYFTAVEGETSILLIIILVILYLIAEVIHYRKFKLPKKVFIIFAACLIGIIILSIIGSEIANHFAFINEQSFRPTN